MSAPLFLGIDCSTTAAKAIVVDETGAVRADARESFALDNPSEGAWEQDARAWWQATRVAVRRAVDQLSPGEVRAIGSLAIAHQRETFVVLDDRFEPLLPAIVWMDTRGEDAVAGVAATLGADRAHALSGKVPCITPSLYKLRALAERRRLPSPKRIADVHAYLVLAMTGRFVTSLGSADPLGLVDMLGRCWSPELLAMAKLKEEELPTLVAPGARIGPLTKETAAALGLGEHVVVVAGIGDGQAAGIGAGIAGPGVAYLNVGTALVAGALDERYVVDRAFRTLFAGTEGAYFLETDLKGGTFTLDWLCDRILGGQAALAGGRARDERLAQLEREAKTIPAGSHGLVAMPYWNGVMNPHWDDAARGVWIGLSGEHSPAHLYRSILEGLAFEQRSQFHALEGVVGALSVVRLIGGATKSDLVSRIFTDVLPHKVERCDDVDATARGAAILAAGSVLSGGVRAAASAMAVKPIAIEKNPLAVARYDALYTEVYRGLYEALRPRLGALRRIVR